MSNTWKSLSALAILLLNLLLGFRGFGRDNRDFFTMKPFSAPLVTCSIETFEGEGAERTSIPFPERSYRQIPAPSFTSRIYLEVLPLYARGLRELLARSFGDPKVTITCEERNGTRIFSAASS